MKIHSSQAEQILAHYGVSVPKGIPAFSVEYALKAAKKAAALDSDNVRIQSRVPWIPYHAKRYEEAEAAYKQLLDRFDGDYDSSEIRAAMRETRLILSNICVQLNRLPEAEEWLESLLDEFPEDIGALNDLGYLWADQGKRLHRALSMIQRAVVAEPENAAYRDSLGWVYYRLQRFDDAARELEKACAGENPDAVILDHLGDAYAKLNQPEKAVQAWKRAAHSLRRKNAGNTKLLTQIENKINAHERSN